MDSEQLSFWSNLSGLTGTIIIAWPAFRINRLAKLLARAEKFSTPLSMEEESKRDFGFLDKVTQKFKVRINSKKDRWNVYDHSALMAGIALLTMSYIINLIDLYLK